jgi:shikimate kinase
MADSAWERVVLVGFMGSGKSTVGRRLARRLEWVFVDLDEAVEAAAGMKVEELFRACGEPAFRQLEADAGAVAAAGTRVVIAPGGGWSLVPGRLDDLPEGSLTVWLRVTPATAVRRAIGTRLVRPLLAGPDPVTRASELLEEREQAYSRARLHLDADMASPTSLVNEIVAYMERR